MYILFFCFFFFLDVVPFLPQSQLRFSFHNNEIRLSPGNDLINLRLLDLVQCVSVYECASPNNQARRSHIVSLWSFFLYSRGNPFVRYMPNVPNDIEETSQQDCYLKYKNTRTHTQQKRKRKKNRIKIKQGQKKQSKIIPHFTVLQHARIDDYYAGNVAIETVSHAYTEKENGIDGDVE